jgi:glycosyltransferase involved in cell wall biosynthesis
MKKVSLLIPFYNEQEVLPMLYDRVKTLIDSNSMYNWEVLLVNDGSSDNSLCAVKQMHMRDSRFRYIDLSRNFGKEIAMLAGLDYVTGDCVVIMDADLQHPPELIPDMLKLWEEGYDDIYGKRNNRGKEPWLRKKLSLLYYQLLQKSTRVHVLQNVGDFRLLDRICIEALKSMRETQRYTKGMFQWIGFKKKEILFDQEDRAAGNTKWNYFKLLGLAVEGITSYTTSPLKMATIMGLIVSLCAFCYMIYIIIKSLIIGDPVAGYPTIMVVMLFLGGVQLLSLGIIGEYIGKIHMEVKNRPLYVAEYKEQEKKK